MASLLPCTSRFSRWVLLFNTLCEDCVITLTSLLAHNPPLLGFIVALFGLMVGSFLNVVISRLPVMLSREWEMQCREMMGNAAAEPVAAERFNLLVPRSRCPKCGHMISALENIPVLSFLFLRGRCRGCRAPISWRYPAIEILTAVLSVLVALHFGYSWQLPGALILTWSLVALAFIDIDEQILPDVITLPVLWLGLLLSLGHVYVDPQTSIIGAAAGYLSLWLVYQLFKLITGKEGMGFGDFKLLALLGAWCGWHYLVLIVLLSSVGGTVIQLIRIRLNQSERDVPFSFGPYLALAGFVAFLWGENILTFYQSFSNY